jgi:transcriptional regulator with XRE-family HTH domain
MTQKALGKEVGVSEETIASIEQGRRPLMPDLAELLDQALGLPGILAVAARRMPPMEGFPAWPNPLMDMERTAHSFSSYENQVMPGLLQTSAYAEAVLRSRIPLYTDHELAAQVAARINRRSVLRRGQPLQASFVIWEPVLRCPIGSRAVLEEQLRYLLLCSELPGVTIQVMPLDSPFHPSLDGPLVLVEAADGLRIAYLERHHGSVVVSDPDIIRNLSLKHAMLRTHAFAPEPSRNLIRSLLGGPEQKTG